MGKDTREVRPGRQPGTPASFQLSILRHINPYPLAKTQNNTNMHLTRHSVPKNMWWRAQAGQEKITHTTLLPFPGQEPIIDLYTLLH